MKHILASGGKCMRLNPMTLRSTSILRVAFMRESQMFKALIENKQTPNGVSKISLEMS
jgi:hypothetical protein